MKYTELFDVTRTAAELIAKGFRIVKAPGSYSAVQIVTSVEHTLVHTYEDWDDLEKKLKTDFPMIFGDDA